MDNTCSLGIQMWISVIDSGYSWLNLMTKSWITLWPDPFFISALTLEGQLHWRPWMARKMMFLICWTSQVIANMQEYSVCPVNMSQMNNKPCDPLEVLILSVCRVLHATIYHFPSRPPFPRSTTCTSSTKSSFLSPPGRVATSVHHFSRHDVAGNSRPKCLPRKLSAYVSANLSN
jgi:hypothetical protein